MSKLHLIFFSEFLLDNCKDTGEKYTSQILMLYVVCMVPSVLTVENLTCFSVSASHTVGHEFTSRPGHTKDHHENGTNCLPAWHAMR